MSAPALIPAPSAELRGRQALVDVLAALGVAEREIARRAGLSHSTFNHLVTGRRTSCLPATAQAIETALGVNEGALFLYTPTERHIP